MPERQIIPTIGTTVHFPENFYREFEEMCRKHRMGKKQMIMDALLRLWKHLDETDGAA